MSLRLSIFAGQRASRLCLRSGLFAVLFSLAAEVSPAHARGPDPPQRIALEPLGFQTISPRYLVEGATMLTVDYIDNEHILVTFGIAQLMPRLSDCPAEDEDRIVRAVLLELPTGRELARTEWRFHDLGQFLWSLGEGHFLLRKRDALTTFSPLQNLPSANSFSEQPFLHFDRRIAAIVVSANHDLLSIETVRRVPPRAAVQAASQTVSQAQSNQSSIGKNGLQRRDPGAPKPDPTPNEIEFVRLLKAEAAPTAHPSSHPAERAASHSSRFFGRVDGRIFTSTAVSVPLTTEGFLRTKAATRDGVLLDFLTFTGKDIDLGDFATSCPPRPTFVSPSEFVAFGCRGSVGALDLAGFNLHGDFLWQINFDDEQAYPSFASSVSAGRFAFSRTVTATHVFGNETPSMSQLQAQEVRVIQTYNGKQLLRVVTSPIQRAGQNFALSPDGLSLAVIHDNLTSKADVVTHHTSIEIYKLPPLSERDQSQMKLEAALAPAPADAQMRFSAEEIKAALAKRREATESDRIGSHAVSSAGSQLAGDPIPPPAIPTSGTIPSSDPAPACATLTATASETDACPVKPSMATDPGADAEKLRKAPTLYETAAPK